MCTWPLLEMQRRPCSTIANIFKWVHIVHVFLFFGFFSEETWNLVKHPHGKHWYPAFWTPTTFRAMSGTMRIILDKLNVGETHWCLVIGHCFLSTSHSRKKCSMSHVAAFSVCFFLRGSATVYEVYEADVHLEFIEELLTFTFICTENRC